MSMQFYFGKGPFPPGSRVFLRSCPFGEPGTVVQKVWRNKISVRWSDGFVGRHRISALVAAEELNSHDEENADEQRQQDQQGH